jgi:glycosyltransferase involved in cell wall biosynthesis
VHFDALSARASMTRTPLVVQNYVTAAFLDEILSGAGGWNKRVRAGYWRSWVTPRLRAARAVIADSPGAGRALAERLGLRNVQVHIGMAVDPAEFDAVDDAARAAVRVRLGLGADRIVLAPSRMALQKGADWLVEAAGPLLREIPDWRLVMPGAVNDAAFAAQVRALAAPLGDRVVFGPVSRPELVALFREGDVVVLPSRGETVGGVVLEGMYAGAACIVSDAVEAAREEYLRDGENGLLVPVGDVEALRAALARALREDTTALRAAGRRMVAERFTWEASVDRLTALYAAAMQPEVARA